MYGATVAGVEALFQDRSPFGPTTEPTEAEVEGWLAAKSAEVYAVAGDLGRFTDVPPGAGIATMLTASAAHAIHLGVGALVEAAAQPELARPNDVSSYASWLQQAYKDALEALRLAVAGAADDDGDGIPDALDVDEDPAWSFPPASTVPTQGW